MKYPAEKEVLIESFIYLPHKDMLNENEKQMETDVLNRENKDSILMADLWCTKPERLKRYRGVQDEGGSDNEFV